MPMPEPAEPIRVGVHYTFNRWAGIAIYERINVGIWKRVASRADGDDSFAPVNGRIRRMPPEVENWSPWDYEIRDKILRYCIQFGIDMPNAEGWYRRRRILGVRQEPILNIATAGEGAVNASGANNYPMMWPPTYTTASFATWINN